VGQVLEGLIIFLVMFVTIVGPSAVIAAIGYASIRALGRNPSAAPKILQAMIIALVFAEAIAIVALLILFQLFGKG
jgi:F-type H+-transporting ATPase subunit c